MAEWFKAPVLKTGVPARVPWVRIPPLPPAKGANHPALPYSELPEFINALRERDGIAAAALEFQILTVARPGNALGARWTEFDRNAAVWTIASENMKGDKEHKVPLSPAALAVLDRMEKLKNGKYVFYSPGTGRPLSDRPPVRYSIGWGATLWCPGFRSTFRDWAAERSYPDAVAEAALAHSVPDAVVAAYKRTTFFELRKKMMDDWAAFATSDPAKTGDNVVELRVAQ